VVQWPKFVAADPKVRFYQVSRGAVCLERAPLNLMRITEELLEMKSGGSGIENRD
jgi:hypothetical protein